MAREAVPEAEVQRAVAEYMDASPFYRSFWFHPPQERWEGRHAKILARAGVKAGIPDILVVRPSGAFSGLALELKRPKAPPSAVPPAQRAWLRTFDQCGWATCVARGVDEALAVLQWYAGGAVREKGSENQPLHTP